MEDILSPNNVLHRGLTYLGITYVGKSETCNQNQFRKHYGSSPLDLAEMWHDLKMTDLPNVRLEANERTESGFLMFMIAHFFLWTYPKNSYLLASSFNICERYVRGDPFWKWISKIAALKVNRVVWNRRLDDPHSETFIVTVDGVDCRTWEPKHETLPLDRQACSQKFKHGAVKYEIGFSVFDNKCVWVNGPHRGGKHDLVMFREGLKTKMAPGKMAIADRGYRSKYADERRMLSLPDRLDHPRLSNFKSRARLRHESFNGRLKFFRCLSDTFRHGIVCHKKAFEAVVVIVQYQMDNGTELYSV